jgi:hypothetical protein
MIFVVLICIRLQVFVISRRHLHRTGSFTSSYESRGSGPSMKS